MSQGSSYFPTFLHSSYSHEEMILMGLAARTAAGPPPVRRGTPCSVATVRHSLDVTDREALDRIIADPSWTVNAIYDVITAEGHEVSRHTIRRHRVGQCRCGREETA